MKTRFQKAVSFLTASALLLSTVTGIGIWQQGRGANAKNNVVLENPVIQADATMLAEQKVTWDCVYFGNYPQAEVVTSAATYSALDAGLYEKEDILVDPVVYDSLEKAADSDWVNDELKLNGVKYRRMRSEAADYQATVSTASAVQGSVYGSYQWSDTTTWHYFKYEPIKWRVLSTDGKKALLLSDIGLDGKEYDRSNQAVTWRNCSVRSWLHGYGTDYAGKGFAGSAFDQKEVGAVMTTELMNDEPGNPTIDKIFLLSQTDVSRPATGSAIVSGKSAKAFTGSTSAFREADSCDEARMSYCSTYAKAMGVQVCSTVADNTRIKSCGQILRNTGSASVSTVCILPNGKLTMEENSYDSVNRTDYCYAIRPALYLDLSKTDLYEYAGTVCSDGTVKDADEVVTGKATLSPAPSSSASPSADPSASPSIDPSAKPSVSPSIDPSASPSVDPSANPSESPSADPSAKPSESPSVDPSASPSVDPSASPSVDPSANPSANPSAKPSVAPTESPTPGETIVIEKTVYKSKYFTDEETMGVYKITKTGDNGTVIYVRPTDKTQKSVTIPDTVEYRDNTYRVVAIGEHAFYKNKKLQRITLGENVTKIANRAFYKCTNLKKVNFNKKLKRIGTKAFFRCNSLEKIVLPAKVEHIGVRAFYKCKNLKKVVLSKNMLEIGTKSFYQCKKLSLDMRKVKRRHIAIGRKPFSGVKQVKYGSVKSRPSK